MKEKPIYRIVANSRPVKLKKLKSQLGLLLYSFPMDPFTFSRILSPFDDFF